jgi:Trypsin
MPRFFVCVKSSVQRKPGMLFALFVAGGLFLAGAAVSQTSPKAAQHIDCVTLSPGQQRAVQWTEGRLRSAKPLPIPVAKVRPGGAPAPAPSGPRSAGPVGSGSAQNVGAAARKTGDPNSVPLRWAGKFFFKKPDGDDYICSAQFITPHVILTAAHCMRDDETGKWYHDFLFELQYERGQATQKLTPKNFATWSAWVHGEEDDETFWHYDYAMILTEDSSKTGNFGWQYNYATSQYPNAVKVGYPADILDGEVVQMDGGPLTEPQARPGIVRLQHGNPKNAGGSSGGAWVGNFNTATGQDTNMVISVTSHHVGDETTVSFGPHFDADFKKLLDYVQSGCK